MSVGLSLIPGPRPQMTKEQHELQPAWQHWLLGMGEGMGEGGTVE